jgi:hypothetical protein
VIIFQLNKVIFLLLFLQSGGCADKETEANPTQRADKKGALSGLTGGLTFKMSLKLNREAQWAA